MKTNANIKNINIINKITNIVRDFIIAFEDYLFNNRYICIHTVYNVIYMYKYYEIRPSRIVFHKLIILHVHYIKSVHF